MKVLLTSAMGYTGVRLLPVLLEKGYEVVCLVRDRLKFKINYENKGKLEVISGDLLREWTLNDIPTDIDAAYYLSNTGSKEFTELEALSAHNFVSAINKTHCSQVIFLGNTRNEVRPGAVLPAAQNIESILSECKAALTILRVSLVIGPNSASFALIRNLTEKLPLLFAPKWVNRYCQPIAIADVVAYLEGAMLNKKTFDCDFEIGGPEVMTFKELMMQYADVKKLHFKMMVLPLLMPKISLYWLKMITQGGYTSAENLIGSLKVEKINPDNRISTIIPHQCLCYTEALKLAM